MWDIIIGLVFILIFFLDKIIVMSCVLVVGDLLLNKFLNCC